jgi:uncharacterized protein
VTASPDRTIGARALPYDECCWCGRRWALPRTACPECGTPEPRRRTAAGRGRVTAVTVVHPGSGEPYTLVLVDLDEGVRVMGRAADGVVVGARVEVRFVEGLPSFEIAEG